MFFGNESVYKNYFQYNHQKSVLTNFFHGSITVRKRAEYLVLRFQSRLGRKDFLPVEPQGGLSFLFHLSEPKVRLKSLL